MVRKPELQPFRFDLRELSGALGDLGVLLPLLAALITLNGLSGSGVLVRVGLAYLLAGLYYRLPIPVQPLKAMAAIAIAQGLSGSVIAAGGWWMAAVLLLLAATGLIHWVGRLFNRAIVRGIQLGLALMLIRSGVILINRPQIVYGGAEALMRLGAQVPASWLLAVAAILLLVICLRSRWPAALIVLVFGAIAAITVGKALPIVRQVTLGITLPQLAFPSREELSAALVFLVIPQLPLTLGNAVFATANAARTYFGDRARRVTPKALLTTMGISQMLAAACGGMPICHGSGGLTAHYKLGARSGGAPLILGTLCLCLGLFAGENILPLLALVPYPVLGVLLVFTGIQHGFLVRDLARWDEILTASGIAATSWLTHNLAIGLGVGLLIWQCCRLVRRVTMRTVARTIHNVGFHHPVTSPTDVAPGASDDTNSA